MFGRFAAGFAAPWTAVTVGREKRVEEVVGERWSMEEWDELETTDRRGWGWA